MALHDVPAAPTNYTSFLSPDFLSSRLHSVDQFMKINSHGSSNITMNHHQNGAQEEDLNLLYSSPPLLFNGEPNLYSGGYVEDQYSMANRFVHNMEYAADGQHISRPEQGNHKDTDINYMNYDVFHNSGAVRESLLWGNANILDGYTGEAAKTIQDDYDKVYYDVAGGKEIGDAPIRRNEVENSAMQSAPGKSSCAAAINLSGGADRCPKLQVWDLISRQFEIHLEKQRVELQHLIQSQCEQVHRTLDEGRQKHARDLVSRIEERASKRLRAKEEEIVEANRKSLQLEERLKQLALETQMWRNVAKTSEMAALHLKQSLKHVVARARDPKNVNNVSPLQNVVNPYVAGPRAVEEGCGESELVDDAESACQIFRDNAVVDNTVRDPKPRRKCKFCRINEVCVLLLPCRHLCLCGDCEGRLDACPLCGTPKSASVHVHMS